MGMYPILSDIGYFSKDELKKIWNPRGNIEDLWR